MGGNDDDSGGSQRQCAGGISAAAADMDEYFLLWQGVCRGVALPYDTLFLGREKSGMNSNLLVQRIKYQNGFYCDAI
jgi:hypothetical protein